MNAEEYNLKVNAMYIKHVPIILAKGDMVVNHIPNWLFFFIGGRGVKKCITV